MAKIAKINKTVLQWAVEILLFLLIKDWLQIDQEAMQLMKNLNNMAKKTMVRCLTPFEKKIILRFEKGMTQEEISYDLKKNGMTPNSLSLIEKTIRVLKAKFRAKTLFQLALILHENKLLVSKKFKV